MDEKDRSSAPDLGAAGNDETSGRVYDLDTDAAEPVDESDVPPEAGVPEAGAEDASRRRRPILRLSRRDVLDRMAEKNTAITKLAKEKNALEKAQAALEGEKAVLAAGKDQLEAQIRDLKDKWMRSVADLENYRKRSTKEWELLKQQTKTEIILEVLNSLDDFERAFAVVEDRDEGEFVRGIRLIHNNLLQVLQRFGVEEIDALHQPFDPNRHMAIGQTETSDVASGNVAQVVQRGYLLNGTVIRPARVFVAK